jgi:hypothetical protein
MRHQKRPISSRGAWSKHVWLFVEASWAGEALALLMLEPHLSQGEGNRARS